MTARGIGAIIVGVAALTNIVASKAPDVGAQTQSCLHGNNESAQQLARRREAVRYVRTINAAQAQLRA